MASVIVRRLDADTKARLRIRAAHHGCSMEEEARQILKVALTSRDTGSGNLVESIRARFARLGGVDLPNVPRDPLRRPPRLSR